MRGNKVAVALGLDNTAVTLAALRQLEDFIGLAEIRLDRMREYDLARLISEAPCPLIMTCRPTREGGVFNGAEDERLDILERSSELGCAYVDIEWDVVDDFSNRGTSTRIIVSRHYYDRMPDDLWEQYLNLRDSADVVKLVGTASSATETIPVLDLIAAADTPVIAIAMGEAGLATRLLGPCFDACLLTYGGVDSRSGTAPGQIAVAEMVDQYSLHNVSAQTTIELSLHSRTGSTGEVSGNGDGSVLRLTINVEPSEIDGLIHAYEGLSPRISVRVAGKPDDG